MSKNENIKGLWKRMLRETQGKVVGLIISESEFGVTDPVYVKQTWIWGGKTPEKFIDRVVEIFQNALILQEEKTRKLID